MLNRIVYKSLFQNSKEKDQRETFQSIVLNFTYPRTKKFYEYKQM
ncbi:hypothetical protein LEP1GSC083_5206 [Leptospira interrogans serovar Pyrogenes str. L0374]|uniref:Uncharacterized protein n=6 Tax=Leptospira interrogans TaxID=173 RepID=A0A0E2CY84_LEPIR|nr:hypothetical protein BRAT_06950 [Leptospira interrogans serovar Bratislava]EKO05088.1 hypothetical protein LEP1GSC077_1028 [Leptospira interrogans str. C10069]EKO26196.1 hypothetical protein LEP1GSC104_3341 [Leptospira interrogans str. UI 12621]EKR52528.1 hypothetical protein LEP1GSC105_0804 [Leptospira interrogans str. UI 12758]EMF41326.1 hypothetical protein LEP1GSC067_0767 [Leptospira interrogans serovar Lora str. TE 1992]EMJ36644.1 hypothetical protein LEP1GSC079_3903 [Leptospira interr